MSDFMDIDRLADAAEEPGADVSSAGAPDGEEDTPADTEEDESPQDPESSKENGTGDGDTPSDADDADDDAEEDADDDGVDGPLPLTSVDDIARKVARGETIDDEADGEGDGEGGDKAPQKSPPPKKAASRRRGQRTTKKRPAPRRGKKSDDAPPPTPIAEVGIPADPDPTAPFPGEREAAPAPAPSKAKDAPSLRVYTAHDELPPDEADPYKRDGVTYGTIEPEEGLQFPDQSGGRRSPSNLTDICRDYRIGHGDESCYILVERKKPATWQSVQCAGYLGKIREPLSEHQFKDLVGGGTYELVVYGPDPRGKRNPHTGAIDIKALTKPIMVHHPGRPRFVDLDAVFSAEGGDRSDDMQGWNALEGRRGFPGRGEATSADAAIHRDSLTFAQKVMEQQQQELKEARSQRSRSDDSTSPAVIQALENAGRAGVEALKETSETTKQMLQRQLEDKSREIEELRQEMRQLRDAPRGDDNKGAWDAVARMAETAIGSRGSNDEITRLHDAHTREVSRLVESHKNELAQLRQNFDDRLKSRDGDLERERERSQARERELREEFDRRERAAREEFERRERALEERYKDRIAAMEKDHARELEAIKRQEELVRETHKSSYETRLSAAEERVRMAKEEADRAREEAANKEDVFAQMERIQAQAELLGFKKQADENPPNSWQERVAAALGNALENAPAIFDSATKTFQARQEAIATSVQAMRAAQAPPQRQLPPNAVPRPAARPPAPQRRFWATEDGAPLQTQPIPEPQARPDQKPPPARAPGAPPPEPDVETTAEDGPEEAQQSAPEPRQAPHPQQQQTRQPARSQPLPVDDNMLDTLRQMLEASFGHGVDPADFAQGFYNELGPQQLRAIVNGMTADSVLDALSEHPRGANSTLLSRDGRAWFKSVWAHGQQLVTQ